MKALGVTVLSKLWYLRHAEQKGHKRATHLADLFKDVIMLGLANGMVYLAILYRGGKPIAAQANYLDKVRGEVLFHVGGRDDAVKDLSSGLMLQAHCIRWAIANGFKRFDFTIGNEPYKYSLGGVDREIFSRELHTGNGANITGILDGRCRKDVEQLIKRYRDKERPDDAQIAFEQALQVWPDFSLE